MKGKHQNVQLATNSAEPVAGNNHKPNGLFNELSVQLLRRGHRVRFQAPGWSMHPTIKDRETVTVGPIAPSDVRKGDIVFYQLNGGVFVHRVVRIKNGDHMPSFVLRGDALGSPDESVTAQQVLGKVVCVERNGRSINPYGWELRIFRQAYNSASRLKRSFLRKLL
jgi:hypothetical protein